MKIISIIINKITSIVVKLNYLMIQMRFWIRFMNNKMTKNKKINKTMFKRIIKYKNIYFKKSLNHLKLKCLKLLIKSITKQQLIS